MKVVDLRFVKERESKKAQAQAELMAKLAEKLPACLEEKYPDVQVKVRYSSASGMEVSGFKGDEKEAFMSFMQELWEDPFLLE